MGLSSIEGSFSTGLFSESDTLLVASSSTIAGSGEMALVSVSFAFEGDFSVFNYKPLLKIIGFLYQFRIFSVFYLKMIIS